MPDRDRTHRDRSADLALGGLLDGFRRYGPASAGQADRVEGAAQLLLRGLVRGDEDPLDVVRRLGGIISSPAGWLRLELGADFPTVELPVSDLAHGLLVHWSRGSTLQEWASIVLCLNVIQFVEAESPEDDRLLEALWQASAGEPIADDDLALARTLTSKAQIC